MWTTTFVNFNSKIFSFFKVCQKCFSLHVQSQHSRDVSSARKMVHWKYSRSRTRSCPISPEQSAILSLRHACGSLSLSHCGAPFYPSMIRLKTLLSPEANERDRQLIEGTENLVVASQRVSLKEKERDEIKAISLVIPQRTRVSQTFRLRVVDTTKPSLPHGLLRNPSSRFVL